eukprot:1903033-Prymnesium_polylepis.2
MHGTAPAGSLAMRARACPPLCARMYAPAQRLHHRQSPASTSSLPLVMPPLQACSPTLPAPRLPPDHDGTHSHTNLHTNRATM